MNHTNHVTLVKHEPFYRTEEKNALEGDLSRKGLGQLLLISEALQTHELGMDVPLLRGIGLTEFY